METHGNATSITPTKTSELSWKDVLGNERQKSYFQKVTALVEEARRSGKAIYPPNSEVFSALSLTPFQDVRVVILGQDPYHGPGQAHGLCFSVAEGIRQPPSLQNIFKEIQSDLGTQPPVSGNLERWATQGVLLLNSVLTVEAHKAGSHAKLGWEEFTDAVIRELNAHRKDLVFLLWGSYAKQKGAVINQEQHLVLQAPHPSPLSAHRGFFGCKHFSKANAYLTSRGYEPICW